MLQLYLTHHLKVHLHTEVYTESTVDSEVNNWSTGNMLWYIQEYFKENRTELFIYFLRGQGTSTRNIGGHFSIENHPCVLEELHSFYILWGIYVQPTQQLGQ